MTVSKLAQLMSPLEKKNPSPKKKESVRVERLITCMVSIWPFVTAILSTCDWTKLGSVWRKERILKNMFCLVEKYSTPLSWIYMTNPPCMESTLLLDCTGLESDCPHLVAKSYLVQTCRKMQLEALQTHMKQMLRTQCASCLCVLLNCHCHGYQKVSQVH